MRALFVNYQGGQCTQQNKYALVKVEGVDDRNKAAIYIGRKIVWNSPNDNRLIGKIVGIHGRKGTLKARFRKGLPGEALGTELIIL